MSYTAWFLLVGALFGVAATFRLYAGRCYLSRPDMRDPERTDPKSFWVSIALLGFGALVFISGGVHALTR